jgi:hypothetical protein
MGRASNEIRERVLQWDGITVHPHRFGGMEFRLGRRELGHLHGESLLDVPFPLNVKEELIAAGKVQNHHVLPESGWISYRIHSHEDIEQAVTLLQRSYNLAIASKKRKAVDGPITISKEYGE